MVKRTGRLSFCLIMTFMLLSLLGGQVETAAAQTPAGSPLQPLLAWSMAGDGSLFVLDAG